MINGDDHREDLKALLRKQFGTLRQFEVQYGLPHLSAKAAIVRPHRAAERAISDAIGRAAHHIWPSRYNADGSRLEPQPKANYSPARGGRQ